MKRILTFLIACLIFSCSTTSNINSSTTSKIDWSNSYWGIVESEEAYLYTSDSLTSIVDKEIKKGSILYFHNQVGDFKEVYLVNPQKIDKEVRQVFRYYLYKPQYQKLSYEYHENSATLYEIPFDKEQTYILGERGGCYYINKYGNKTYVNRSYCANNPNTPSTSPEPKSSYEPKKSSNCNSVQCSGSTKKGTSCRNRTTNCSGRCHLH